MDAAFLAIRKAAGAFTLRASKCGAIHADLRIGGTSAGVAKAQISFSGRDRVDSIERGIGGHGVAVLAGGFDLVGDRVELGFAVACVARADAISNFSRQRAANCRWRNSASETDPAIAATRHARWRISTATDATVRSDGKSICRRDVITADAASRCTAANSSAASAHAIRSIATGDARGRSRRKPKFYRRRA